MSTPNAPEPPANAGPAGKRLWKMVQAEYSLSGADLVLLEQAVLVRDELDQLETLVRASGPLIKDKDGLPIGNPASVQHRLLVITLARLMAAIRVVGDETGVERDPTRPQHRSGVRGVYPLKAAE